MKYMITRERIVLKVAPTICGTVPAPHSAALFRFSDVRILIPYSASIRSTKFLIAAKKLEDSEKAEESFFISRLVKVNTGTRITKKESTINMAAQIPFFHLYLACISNIYFLISTYNVYAPRKAGRKNFSSRNRIYPRTIIKSRSKI